ncbi:MAG: hypothetical protein ACM34I_07955 [bacterium]
MKFGEMLVQEGLITQDHLKRALERQVVFGGRIGTNLVELGIVKEEELTRFLSKYLRIPAVEGHSINTIPEDVIHTITPDIAQQYKVIPFRKERKRLHMAMADVRNVTMVDELKFMTGYDIVPYVVSEIRLLYALEKYYGIKRDIRFISVFDGMKEEVKGKNEPAEMLKVKEAFSAVQSKGEVAGLLLNEAKKVASRIALFMLKGDLLQAWAARGLNIDGFSAKLELDSVVSQVLTKKSYYRGPLLTVPGNRALISIFGGAPQDCLVMPIGIREKTVAFLYADNGNTAVLSANLTYVNTLVTMASFALEILILKKKIMDL